MDQNAGHPDSGLICAYVLDGKGGARAVSAGEVMEHDPARGFLWVHVDGASPAGQNWVTKESRLPALVAESLVETETRPRCVIVGEGMQINMRGVNLNPGADPEDMVAIRIWADAKRAITVRRRHLMAIEDLRESLHGGEGPTGPGEMVAMIAANLVRRMQPVIEELDDALDGLEEEVVKAASYQIRTRLATLRHEAIALRRYLAPQRDALARAQAEPVPWLDTRPRARLRETADRVTRIVEDLDAVRERAAVIQDEVANRIAEDMNRKMYVLTVVATILLPLGFFTGLLGVNVDGIPGAKDAPWAFGALCGALAIIAGAEIWLLRRLRWRAD